MSELDNVLVRLKLLNAAGPAKLAARGSPHERIHLLAGGGVIPDRLVRDMVTGQVATVVGSGVAYLPQSMLDEVKNGG